ncbi:MAG: hypothetical protein KJ970_09955 [Candidatus Eisenbacteria bacterium]|uniref:Uncharacterized protein n=1 Tax=Eiseniibacteriota bacterium TaxID=2212470 RepID=A0A948RY55_UNCEI|nr:hypothetical protein [Candidatus Eisenbacteria bacterium]MBU2691242.1 hypothetical protein [Candidatus Eisenbacteria bacterium]
MRERTAVELRRHYKGLPGEGNGECAKAIASLIAKILNHKTRSKDAAPEDHGSKAGGGGDESRS